MYIHPQEAKLKSIKAKQKKKMNSLFIRLFLNNGLHLNENWNLYRDMGEVYRKKYLTFLNTLVM